MLPKKKMAHEEIDSSSATPATGVQSIAVNKYTKFMAGFIVTRAWRKLYRINIIRLRILLFLNSNQRNLF
jgi:hypothetical protein